VHFPVLSLDLKVAGGRGRTCAGSSLCVTETSADIGPRGQAISKTSDARITL